jgi:hypothetical protein
MLSWLPDVSTVTVQPGWFADNYFAVLGQAAQFGVFGLPLGKGQNAPPSNEDIARVIVACLADLDHSKGGRRMWCSDASCGARSRIARFRTRVKPKIEEF